MAIIGADPGSGRASARIETPRLVLRPVMLADAPWIERYVSDWDVARHTARIPHPYPVGGAVDFIRNLDPREGPTFAIERRQEREPLGLMGLEFKEAGEVETGFWIGKPFWGQGYASEALQALTPHVFVTIGVPFLVATASSENRASIRVQEKVGLVFTGMVEIDAPARGGKALVERRCLERERWRQRDGRH